jgi:hypothetical protein
VSHYYDALQWSVVFSGAVLARKPGVWPFREVIFSVNFLI